MVGIVAFEEEQKFDPRLANGLYLFLAAVGALAWFAARGGSEGDAAVIALLPAFLALFVLFSTATMTTRVDDAGLAIETLYFVKRRIGFDDIESASPVTYRPIRDYGGWGYRLSREGKAYNMQGDRGVQLHLKNGGRVLVGSQRPEELASAIASRLRS